MAESVTPLNVGPGPLRLRVNEIFCSIQGESTSTGIPTIFVRLTGCPLRCHYCDTAYAFTEGRWMSLDQIRARVAGFNLRHVTVTGGEPLAQKNCLELLRELCDLGYVVSLETSGALDISVVDPRVIKVMDLKTPASGESARNRWDNIPHLREQDQVKFVLCDRKDYVWAKSVLLEHELMHRCEVLFSPAFESLEFRQLAEWILEDRLPVRFQLQLHKLLWGDERGR
ncbi:MAG: 7-carboxy-7-deazaguanine synthase QueE [Gammaproteobacteria bacterium]|nr:7-carboxy-7-deazaguanine synthase QueE [Gammaproteobacteria bacterium]